MPDGSALPPDLPAGLLTPVCDRADAYRAGVLAGVIPAGKKAFLAVERAERDREKAGTDGLPFVFDRARAEHMAGFVETMPHIEGEFAAAGANLQLLGWQAFVVTEIGGWIDPETGFRRFRTAYVEVPRKNGKSTLLSGLALYLLGPDMEDGPKVYTAAATSDQARIVLNIARTMALRAQNKGVRLLDALGWRVDRYAIVAPNDPTVEMTSLASQTNALDGKNPHAAIIDELHQHKNRDVWDAMSSGFGSRAQPLLIAITTAGVNTNGICYEVRRLLEHILEGRIENERFFGVIYDVDEGDDPADPTTWAKANPSLGSAKTEEYMAHEWELAKASAAATGNFLRKQLNVWTQLGATALDLDCWRAADNPALTLQRCAGRAAYIGVDLATRNDFTSIVAAMPDDQTGRIDVLAWHFLPLGQVEKPGNEHLAAWAKQGWIHTTPGFELDLNYVEALVLALAGKRPAAGRDWGWPATALDVKQVTYDPQFAQQMVAAWDAAGILTVELRQGARNWNEPFNRLIGAVDNELVSTNGDPVLRWMAGNTLEKRVLGGDFIYPDKISPADKIDGIAALLNAIAPLHWVKKPKPQHKIVVI